MNDSEREHWEHVLGSASELQNTFAWNMMNRRGDDPRISESVKAGKFVVVYEITEYCPSTDAIMGSRKDFGAAYDTREAANEAILKEFGEEGPDPDCSVYVLPVEHQPKLRVTEYNRDEIPF